MQRLQQLIFSLKGKITNQAIQKIKNTAKQVGAQDLKLWRIKSEVKFMFKAAKIQSYLLLFTGIVILPITLYQKYKDDNQKLPYLIAVAPFAAGICFSPIYCYRKYTKNLLSQISYNLKTNCFQITKFNKIVIKDVRPSDLKIETNKNGIIQKIINSKINQVSYTQGIGQWSNLDLFKQILKRQQL